MGCPPITTRGVCETSTSANWYRRVGRSHVVHWPERVERHSTRKPEAAAVGVVGKRILRPMMDVKHIARTPVPGRVRKLILDFFTPHRGPGVKAGKRGEINDERCGNHGSEGKCEPCGKTSGDCRDALRGQEEQERDDEEDRAREDGILPARPSTNTSAPGARSRVSVSGLRRNSVTAPNAASSATATVTSVHGLRFA